MGTNTGGTWIEPNPSRVGKGSSSYEMLGSSAGGGNRPHKLGDPYKDFESSCGSFLHGTMKGLDHSDRPDCDSVGCRWIALG